MRLFIAIRLAPELIASLTALQAELRRQNLRGSYAPAENLHLTLAFLGELPDPAPVLEAMETVDFAPFSLALEGVGSFGDLLWAGLGESEALTACARRLRRALAEAGLPYDRKRFTPHITLLRRAQPPLPPIPAPAPAGMTVERLSLMRSDRGKRGMIYTELGSVFAK